MDDSNEIMRGALNLLREQDDKIKRLRELNAEMLMAMVNLLDVLDAAGIDNLANGVQLGQISWLIKARDRVADAKAAVVASDIAKGRAF